MIVEGDINKIGQERLKGLQKILPFNNQANYHGVSIFECGVKHNKS
jgi:hypothetical protein